MSEFALKMKSITKTFPGVLALDDVSLSVKKGEVHALLGENGAGKSTLMKVLSGMYIPEEGEIYLDDIKVHFVHPHDAIEKGIGVIYQELNLVPAMSAIDNVVLGHEVNSRGFINEKKNKEEAKSWLDSVVGDNNMSYTTQVSNLSVAQQQMVEIAKALSLKARLLIMDEPSATLTDKELDSLFDIIRQLQSNGVTIIYISHRLDEVFEVCDRATVLRDGGVIGTVNVEDVDKSKIISMMIGRELTNIFPKRESKPTKNVALSVENLTRDKMLKDISFKLYEGEILGISGLVGSGRTELARAIIGADKYSEKEGRIELRGKEVDYHHPRNSIKDGIAYLSEDRKAEGLFLDMSIITNITMASLNMYKKNGFVDAAKERRNANEYVDSLNIKTPSINKFVGDLSGGNQQKVVIAKWMTTKSKILILDEPTRGIDVGAKYEIYELMIRLVEDGYAIIMISAELPEILGMSDRILIMHEGKVTGEVMGSDATEDAIMHFATGQIDEQQNTKQA